MFIKQFYYRKLYNDLENKIPTSPIPPTHTLKEYKNIYRQIFSYIKSDYIRYGKKPTLLNILITVFFGWRLNHCFVFTFWFRLCTVKNIFYFFVRIMHRKYSIKYGFIIPVNTKIGYGLFIGHGIGVVINKTAVIGNNCNLSQFVTIGSNHEKAAVIGDNVYIRPSVCIVEDIIRVCL
jgi:serine O-acetyltransferase